MADAPAFLAKHGDQLRTGWVKRFRPALWTVDFPRPMMAALTVAAPDAVRVDLDFLTRGDLAGLIWASEDRWSHPLVAYATDRDYRGATLAFDWSASGVVPLDQVNGAVLTIEGRDAEGAARSWYVRLWNYAVGTPQQAQVTLDFATLRAGFGAGGEPVFAGDIDRMFVSVVPEGFDGTVEALAAPVAGVVTLAAMRVTGRRTMVAAGDAFLPEHGLRMASGYDDSYHQAPERLVEQWEALGYRALVNHYVGMSHYYALAHAGGGRFEVVGGLCGSAVAWHRALLRAARARGFSLVLSLSFELFDANAPAAWAQRAADGTRALTGWEPPSTLLSPCNPSAMAWLGGIAAAFAGLAVAAGEAVQFQVGEPWWWVGPDGRPCFYDAATVARWEAERGIAPPAMEDVLGVRADTEREWLGWLGERLAEATFAVRDAARAVAPEGFRSLLLFYAPQVLDADTPDLALANMPMAWSFPQWDVLQLEDYSFVTAGNEAGMARARGAVAAQLGYPIDRQHYLAGFVLRAEEADVAWPRIAAAAGDAVQRGVPEVFLWAWPQVARDGFCWAVICEGEGGDAVEAFHDVRFPLDLGFEAVGGPEFATQVAMLASGHEQRNIQWAQARLSYDAGVGVRSEADLVRLLAFFRARRGRAFAFRFTDPMDCSSAADGSLGAAAVSPQDQLLGVGDGTRLSFPLVKRYGEAGREEVRRITRPQAGTVRVSVGGVEAESGWALLAEGIVVLELPPPPGAEVRSGFRFDVPVRFAVDRLDVSLSGVRSGEAQSVPLVEVRE
jgi:uncharacterized protein (TIGR02217 family)